MLKLLALGVAAFIVSLVVTAPVHVVAKHLPPDIQASGLQGTLWQGQANRLQVRNFNLGRVSWDVNPLALLVGRIESDVSIDRPGLQGRGTVGVGFDSLRLADTHVLGSSDLLAPYLANYGVDIDGQFEVDVRSSQFNDRGPQALDGLVVWRDAELVRPARFALGNVNIALAQHGDTAVAELNNTGDVLRLNGGARLQTGWKYHGRLRIEPTAATPEEVRNALPYLGQPDAQGAITLSRQGTLNLAGMVP